MILLLHILLDILASLLMCSGWIRLRDNAERRHIRQHHPDKAALLDYLEREHRGTATRSRHTRPGEGEL